MPLSLLDVAVPGAPTDDGREVLGDLVSVSLATRDTQQATFSVHRLVLDVTRRFLAPDVAETRLTEALGWMKAALVGNGQDLRTWRVLVPLAEHAETVAGHADAAAITDPTARCWVSSASC